MVYLDHIFAIFFSGSLSMPSWLHRDCVLCIGGGELMEVCILMCEQQTGAVYLVIIRMEYLSGTKKNSQKLTIHIMKMVAEVFPVEIQESVIFL